MNDLGNDLRRALDSFGEPTTTLEQLRRRKVRREAGRRVASAVSAIAIVVLSGSLLWSAFRTGGDPPIPGPGTSGFPGLPNNGLISFLIGEVSGRMEGIRLGTVEQDGSDRRALVDGMAEYLTGGWSPDGTQIVFSRDPEKTPDGDIGIWTMNADGTGLTQLTDGSAVDLGAQWSPAGDRILFRRSSDGQAPAIFVMNADGSRLQRLTDDPDLVYLGARWSPDGGRILFIADTTADDGGEGLGIYVMRSDGMDVQQLYQGVNGTPQWSPDGRRILFQSGGRLVVMESDGTDLRPVVDGFEVNGVYDFRWSPDGSRILYTRPISPERGEELWVAAVDGSEDRLVAEGLQWRDPISTWSPDGTLIAFVRDGDIWTVTWDGSREQQVTDTPEYESTPAWGVR